MVRDRNRRRCPLREVVFVVLSLGRDCANFAGSGMDNLVRGTSRCPHISLYRLVLKAFDCDSGKDSQERGSQNLLPQL